MRAETRVQVYGLARDALERLSRILFDIADAAGQNLGHIANAAGSRVTTAEDEINAARIRGEVRDTISRNWSSTIDPLTNTTNLHPGRTF